MLRDNLAGLIEPMLSSAGANPLALCTARKQSSDDRPPCLENPRPEGAESTLTENAASPFQAEPRQKCDFRFDYKGTDVKVEVKCLDTPKVRVVGNGYEGTFQCNASDTTPVELPNGEKLSTNCLVVGGFDLLAVCLFAFGSVWRFAFALNDDLPRSPSKKYKAEQQAYLLKSSMKITLPLQPPFADEPFGLLDRLLAKRAG